MICSTFSSIFYQIPLKNNRNCCKSSQKSYCQSRLPVTPFQLVIPVCNLNRIIAQQAITLIHPVYNRVTVGLNPLVAFACRFIQILSFLSGSFFSLHLCTFLAIVSETSAAAAAIKQQGAPLCILSLSHSLSLAKKKGNSIKIRFSISHHPPNPVFDIYPLPPVRVSPSLLWHRNTEADRNRLPGWKIDSARPYGDCVI